MTTSSVNASDAMHCPELCSNASEGLCLGTAFARYQYDALHFFASRQLDIITAGVSRRKALQKKCGESCDESSKTRLD